MVLRRQVHVVAVRATVTLRRKHLERRTAIVDVVNVLHVVRRDADCRRRRLCQVACVMVRHELVLLLLLVVAAAKPLLLLAFQFEARLAPVVVRAPTVALLAAAGSGAALLGRGARVVLGRRHIHEVGRRRRFVVVVNAL